MRVICQAILGLETDFQKIPSRSMIRDNNSLNVRGDISCGFE
jgi:hypothetical protein